MDKLQYFTQFRSDIERLRGCGDRPKIASKLLLLEPNRTSAEHCFIVFAHWLTSFVCGCCGQKPPETLVWSVVGVGEVCMIRTNMVVFSCYLNFVESWWGEQINGRSLDCFCDKIRYAPRKKKMRYQQGFELGPEYPLACPADASNLLVKPISPAHEEWDRLHDPRGLEFVICVRNKC